MRRLLLMCMLTASATAQSVITGVVTRPDSRWLDKANVVRLSYCAGGMALDAYSTQRFLSPQIQAKYRVGPHELNPIARPFVNQGWKGQLAASGLSFAVVTGSSWLAHRTGHHRIEHSIPLVFGSLSWSAGAWNMHY